MGNIFEQDLDRNLANHQPLTPLSYLERAARVYPGRTAIIHGSQKTDYGTFYRRTRQLASALAQKGIGKGDTITVMLSNTPPMLEAHFGVPMTKAVLHSLNTRLDPAIIAFQLDHAETKIAIVDTEFSKVFNEALRSWRRLSRLSLISWIRNTPRMRLMHRDPGLANWTMRLSFKAAIRTISGRCLMMSGMQ